VTGADSYISANLFFLSFVVSEIAQAICVVRVVWF